MMKRKTTILQDEKTTKAELSRLTKYYNKLTAELPHAWTLEKLNKLEGGAQG